jgi:hypothetical protein
MTMGPDRIQNQDWLCWQVPATTYPIELTSEKPLIFIFHPKNYATP